MRFPLLFGTLLFISPSAWSADRGIYRPGPSYLSIHANTPDQCQSQCLGDAMCKAWNFVQISSSPTGAICEFKTRITTPIPSQFSISGESPNAIDSVKIIPAGYRTTRLGQPSSQYRPSSVKMTRLPSKSPTVRVGAVPLQQYNHVRAPQAHNYQRTEVRHQQVSPQIANQPSAINNQLSRLPVRSHQPTSGIQSQAIRQNSGAFSNRQYVNNSRPKQVRHHQTPTANVYQSQETGAMKPHLDNIQQTYSDVNHSLEPQKPAAPVPTQNSMNGPTYNARPASEISMQRSAPPIEPGLAGGPSQPVTQNSLFGSLYDDVKAPRTLQSSDIILGPDAPIKTVDSVPVGKVDVSPL